jgi:hypothetical protein
MPDEITSLRRDCSSTVPVAVWRAFVLLAVALLAVDGGPLSAPGYGPIGRVVRCPWCHKKVRLAADGWGYCRRCDQEFSESEAEEA